MTNSSEAGTFATLDTNIVFTPFDRSNIIAPNNPHNQGHKFPHAVLEIRWEFIRKPDVVRVFNATHLAERVSGFTLENAAIHNQTPELGAPSWATLMAKEIRKAPVQTRPSRCNESSSGRTSGPSSTCEIAFPAFPAHSTASLDTSRVPSTRNASISSGKPSPKTKRTRRAAECPNQLKLRYYSEYDDPDSEHYQQEVYTIYVDPNEEAPGMVTMRKIGSAFTALLAWLRTSQNKDLNEHTPLLNGQGDRFQDEEDEPSNSDNSSVIYQKLKISKAIVECADLDASMPWREHLSNYMVA